MSDLQIDGDKYQPCYINHPFRSEDTDDILLDAVNQLEFTHKDLVRWVTSTKSKKFMDHLEGEGADVDITDFYSEFEFV